MLKMPQLILVSISLLISLTFNTSHAQIQTPVLPPGVYSYTYQNPDAGASDHFLLTPFKVNSNDGPTSRPEIIDGNGDLIWFLNEGYLNTLNFRYFPQTDNYSFTVGNAETPVNYILDNQLNIIDTVASVITLGDSHDFFIASNGNYIVATLSFDTVDLSGEFIGGIHGSSGTILQGFGWQEITPSGTVVFEWNSNDYLDPTESYPFYGYSTNPFDYCHGNAITEDVDGNFILSFRHMNALYKIDRTDGSIIWKLGGNNGDFSFTNDPGFSGQHDVTVLGKDTISIFDNANMSPNQISRGVVYKIDTDNWSVTKIHELTHPNPFFTKAMGSYQYSDSIQTLGFGFIAAPDPGLTVMDANQSIKFELYAADSVLSYRALHKQAANWTRPEITCNLENGQWTLGTISAYTEYLWNTGETSSTITIIQPGDYQVWVNFGSGMLGSMRFTVNDITDPCGTAGLEEQTIQAQLGEPEYFDFLGRKVQTLESGKMYIRSYTGPIQKTEVYIAP